MITNFNRAVAESTLKTALSSIPYSYNKMNNSAEKSKNIALYLAKKGTASGEMNYLTGVIASFDITGSIKWWQQAERYHFFQISMSQSVMHSIKNGSINDFKFLADTPHETIESFYKVVDKYRKHEQMDELGVIYSVPLGLLETAHITTNYLQLLNMYKQRHDHKLKEWHEFCDDIKKFPFMLELIEAMESSK